MKKTKIMGAVLSMLCFGILFGFGSVKAEAAIVPTLVTEVSENSSYQPTTATVSVAGCTDGSATTITEIQMDHKGMLGISYSTTGLADSLDIALYSDAACTQQVGYTVYLSSYTLTYSEEYDINQAGVYYLKTSYSYSYSTSGNANSYQLAAYAYSGEAKTLNTSYQLTYTGNSSEIVYHKLVLKKKSYVGLLGYAIGSNSYYYGVTANIYNSKKNVGYGSLYLSASGNYAQYDYIALEKGTYYVAVSESYPYVLSAKVFSTKSEAGASKKKAVLVKSGKTKQDIFTSGSSTGKAMWYKIKLNKSKKLKFNIKYAGTGFVQYQVIPANSKVKLLSSSGTVFGDKSVNVSSTKKLKKGTYYVKITHYNSSYNGLVSFKCK